MTRPNTLVSKLFRRQKGNCYLCRKGMSRTPGKPNYATVDHVMPKAIMRLANVEHLDGNKKLACKSCNEEKGAKPVYEFMKEKGYLDDSY